MILKMTKISYLYILMFSSLIFFSYGLKFNKSSIHGYNPKHKHYIVYMGQHSFSDSESLINANHRMLASYVGSVKHARNKIVHHYHKSFRGFSALLTPKQANRLRKHSSVVSVFKSEIYKLQTTRTWDFLLEHKANEPFKGSYEQHRDNPKADVVIGHLDSGIWPELANFDPSGLGPPPSYYNGACYPGYDHTGLSICNNKLVGFRFYDSGYQRSTGQPIIKDNQLYSSPRDDIGHGTHTASIAAGKWVNYATYEIPGLSVKGGAPYARLAVYKTCWHDYCDGADVLLGIHDAINDNVDIISMSLGPKHPVPYLQDVFSIGSLHAFLSGKLVVACAGNEGANGPGSVVNAAPWVLTVAATSVDRDFVSNIVLGNGKILKGYGYNYDDLSDHGVVMADDILSSPASYCNVKLDESRVGGKIVVCFMDIKEQLELGNFVLHKSSNVQRAGGVGMILVDHNENEDGRLSYLRQIPTSVIGFSDFQILQQYMKSTQRSLQWVEPTARILSSKTSIRNRRAPNVAVYSGRGPNILTPEIIKPDIAAPGSGIVAGWPRNIPPAPNQPLMKPPEIYPNENKAAFSSGTSMACPHISGVAAVLLSFLKGWINMWNPDILKSALMTTATWWDNTGNNTLSGYHLASPFDLGSGHVVPDLIFSPGLVYPLPIDNLLYFLCSQVTGSIQEKSKSVYDMTNIPMICPDKPFPAYNLNYPSIAINGLTSNPVTVTRLITWIEERDNPYSYRAILDFPTCVSVVVSPSVLNFTPQNPMITYTATFANINCKGDIFGSITWTDGGKHFVKTAVALIVA